MNHTRLSSSIPPCEPHLHPILGPADSWASKQAISEKGTQGIDNRDGGTESVFPRRSGIRE